jgi:hypothetical protein
VGLDEQVGDLDRDLKRKINAMAPELKRYGDPLVRESDWKP